MSGNAPIDAHAVLAKLAWAIRSEAGPLREHNEDCAGAHAPTTPDDSWDRGALFVVADGLGGHAAGEVASRIAVEAALESWSTGPPRPPLVAVRDGLRRANAAVLDAASEPARRGMGTTCTALALSGHEGVVAHVGDSRAYRITGGQIAQLTTDHSRVQELARRGLLRQDQVRTHPARSVLTRSLGAEPAVAVDVTKVPIALGDVFVLCTDGLWDLVDETEMVDAAGGAPREPSAARIANQLVDLALARGAPDNVTAAVVKVTSDQPLPVAGGRRLRWRGWR